MPGWCRVGRAPRACSPTTTCTSTAPATPTSWTPSALASVNNDALTAPERRRPGLGRVRHRQVILGACLALGCLILWAAPAGAHAAVVSSSPAQGQRVAHPPSAVTIVFDQPVKPDDGGVVVLNSSGQDVDEGGSTHPVPDTLQATLSHAL